MADPRSPADSDHRVIPMERQDSGRAAVPPARRITNDADAAQIADATVASWQEIDAALRPIIGPRGVCALYKRSLYLTASSYPWLAGLHEGAQSAMDLAALKAVLVRQDGADARAGGAALLQTLHELLAGLIGPSLAGRLLHPVGSHESGGASAQDASR
jgi:hypothetical protein